MIIIYWYSKKGWISQSSDIDAAANEINVGMYNINTYNLKIVNKNY